MPAGDTCVSGLYEPGAIPASAGMPPKIPVVPSLIDPDNYNPAKLIYSLDLSKFYNSPYHHHGYH